MARKVSFSALESRSARLRLKIRRRPYGGPSLARGIALMYRRNKTNGTWVLKASNGHGTYWTKGFALADAPGQSRWRKRDPFCSLFLMVARRGAIAFADAP